MANVPWFRDLDGLGEEATFVSAKQSAHVIIPAASSDSTKTIYCDSSSGCTIRVNTNSGSLNKANAALNTSVFWSPDGVADIESAMPVQTPQASVPAAADLAGVIDVDRNAIYNLPRGYYWVFWTANTNESRVTIEAN